MSRPISRSQAGLSLVELLVAITLSMLLMVGLLQAFLASKQTYSAHNALSRVQESGRFAIEFLTHDIRNAGYKGECMSTLNNLLNESGTGYSADLFDLNQAIAGTAASAPSWITASSRVAGDVVHVKYAASTSGVTASGNTPANANTIALTGASGIAQDTIIVVSDPLGCDMFQKRNAASASSLSRGNTGTPGNKNPASSNFSHAYDSSMEILTLQSFSYYIGSGANGLPALRRVSFSSGTAVDQVLIEGVQDMKISYGIAGTDKQVSSYVAASAVTNWANVVSVRVQLLVVGSDAGVLPENQTVSFNGANVTIANRRLAQVFSTTIGIRNRLP